MAKQVFIKGQLKLEIPQGQSSGVIAYTFDQEYEFHGLQLFLENPVWNDEVDFKLFNPSGLEVKDYSENTFLTSKNYFIEIKVTDKDEPSEIPSGFIAKFYYYAVDTLGRKAMIWLRLKR